MVKKENQIKIVSDPENITELEAFIDRLRDTEGIGDEVYGNIIISMTEAVNNAIIHGNDCDQNTRVTITFERKGNTLSFTIQDEGEGFDYNNLPDPTDPDNLEKLTGRGVFLMNQLSDMLIFSENGSSVEMQFKV